MSDAHMMPAQPRDRAGKGTARAARRSGMVPAVVYGGKKTPAMILIEERVLKKQAARAAFFGTVYEIKVEGGGTDQSTCFVTGDTWLLHHRYWACAGLDSTAIDSVWCPAGEVVSLNL